ncbi:MAG: sensor histidine kinase [Fusicatenibacter sp.]
MKKKITIQRELTRILFITSAVTLLVIGGIISAVVFRWSSEKAREDLEFYMASIQEQFSEKLLFLEDGIVSLKDNEQLMRFLQNSDISDQEVLDVLEKSLNLYSDRNMVDGEYPIVRDLYIFNRSLQSVGTHFYPSTQSSHKSMEWHLKNELTVYLEQEDLFYYQKNGSELDGIFPVYDENLETIGYCTVVYDLNSICRIFDQLEKYETYYWSFQAPDERCVGGTGFPSEEELRFPNLNGVMRIGKEPYFYSVVQNSFGLTSYILIPKNKIYLTIKPAFQMAWLIVGSLFAGVLLVIRLFGRRMSVPMKKIADKMNQFGDGDFETRLGEYEIVEFQQISQSFNSMAARINQLITEVYETKLIAQESKIQYLQSQTNPHFMFNVLSAIAIRLKMNRDEESYRMVTAFAGLMQGKLFRKDEVEIRAEKEMEIVGFYLYLQGERFKDIITYDISWESEELKECYLPRLSVEPLVENAVIHGLEPKGEEGHISVKITRREQALLIQVTDDGVGFDAEQTVKKEDQNPRVGILNIQRLIQNLYGKEYGLQFESTPGKGTRVLLSLPYHVERIW